MKSDDIEWMNYSISISEQGVCSHLRVGAVLVSKKGELICSAFAGQEGHVSWCSILLQKIRQLKVSTAQSLFLTVNTLATPTTFDLNNLLKKIRINEIYVGLPDPSLTCYLENDPIVALSHIYRYPDQMQCRILEQNRCYFKASKQSLKYSPYYSENRISNLVINTLAQKGLVVSKEELNVNKQESSLASLLCTKFGIEYAEAVRTVHGAISKAFNSKYGTYKYSDDARSLDLNWKENFKSFYKMSSVLPISTHTILNVGVGSGHEAIALFSDCPHITFVDIAQAGLEHIKKKLPLSKTLIASADDLSPIPNNIFDLYISLRTYNSSFFNIKKALLEAHRILKPNAIIIISVANGFLCPERHSIIPGLIIKGTDFVDIYRGMDMVKLIYSELVQLKFENIQFYPTNTEIFLSATSS